MYFPPAFSPLRRHNRKAVFIIVLSDPVSVHDIAALTVSVLFFLSIIKAEIWGAVADMSSKDNSEEKKGYVMHAKLY